MISNQTGVCLFSEQYRRMAIVDNYFVIDPPVGGPVDVPESREALRAPARAPAADDRAPRGWP
jgi:hypothetical protein